MGSSGFLRDLGMEALYIHILEMMSLISETLMSIKGLEYAAFGLHEPGSAVSTLLYYTCVHFLGCDFIHEWRVEQELPLCIRQEMLSLLMHSYVY